MNHRGDFNWTQKEDSYLTGISLAGAGVLLNACRTHSRTAAAARRIKTMTPAPGEAAPVEVTAD